MHQHLFALRLGATRPRQHLPLSRLARLLSTESYLPVLSRPNLTLHISQPSTATAKTPTIIHIPDPTLPRPESDTSIIISPITATPTQYPTILHDLQDTVTAVRELYPASRIGILATSYTGGMAISIALNEGPDNVAALALVEPVVEVIAEGPATYSLETAKWTGMSQAREELLGPEPGKYWVDNFTSPLRFFRESQYIVPTITSMTEEQYAGSSIAIEQDKNVKTLCGFPPDNYIPGVGWKTDLPKDKFEDLREIYKAKDKIMLAMSLGDPRHEPARARAMFMHEYIKSDPKKTQAGIVKEDVTVHTMMEWLEAALKEDAALVGSNVHPIFEKAPPKEVLERRGGVGFDETDSYVSYTSEDTPKMKKRAKIIYADSGFYVADNFDIPINDHEQAEAEGQSLDDDFVAFDETDQGELWTIASDFQWDPVLVEQPPSTSPTTASSQPAR